MRQNSATVLVEQSTLFREGLARILSGTQFRIIDRQPDLRSIGEIVAPPGEQILFVVGLGSAASDGLAELHTIKERYPTARLVVLAERVEARSLVAALHAGADGYLPTTISCEALIKSLELVMLGIPVLPSATVSLIRDFEGELERRVGAQELAKAGAQGGGVPVPASLPTSLPMLSARETQILSCLTEGAPNKLIARRFDITEATVKVHVKAILRKIRVKNRTQAAIWASGNLMRCADDWPGGMDGERNLSESEQS
jgi:two-component system nitrate/nitrite response regulator NarL